MKIAVTGANGFIGQYTMAELRHRGISATAISRTPIEASEVLADHSNVSLNLHEPPDHAYKLMGYPDLVIHLAWGGLPNYKSNHHFTDELVAQYRFLSSLVKSGLRHLIVAGTCFEYGDQSGSICEDIPARPTNPYGFAKDSLRRQLEFLQNEVAFNLTWLRFFYLYGTGQASNSLFSQLKQAIKRGDPVFPMSGGEQLRDYLPIEEAVSRLLDVAEKPANHGIVNICSGRPTSVRRLVEGWLRDYNWQIQLNLGHYPYPDYEPFAFWGNRNKLDRLLESR